MTGIIRGKAFVYGANIDTDQIYPGGYLDLTDPERVAEHTLERVDPDFVREVKPGDMIVADANFGCGSSREHAAVALKASGIAAVLAESFARIFYRNAINLGLPLLVCPGIASLVKRHDLLSVDPVVGTVINLTTGATATAQPLSAYVSAILMHGGVKPMIRRKMGLLSPADGTARVDT
ncbi:MAG: 3-isopropylmalate dehydratase small subunit [Syntrophobacterales bacterium]|nr:3-isopropylmalate dehydratase small subunit [Syntrophobacterales bacterium]